MRASGATNCGLPFSVVDFTNSTIAFLAAPSFQDGSGPAPTAVEGSVCAYAWLKTNRNKNAAPIILFISVGSISGLPFAFFLGVLANFARVIRVVFHRANTAKHAV